MTDWVEVNGARIEKTFFDANVAEAKECKWSLIRPSDSSGHVHCMICNITIQRESVTKERLYKSKAGHLCAYCHDHFVRS